MTIEELIAKLKALDTLDDVDEYITYDPHDAHIEADNLLLQFINDPRVSEAFGEIEKWYA